MLFAHDTHFIGKLINCSTNSIRQTCAKLNYFWGIRFIRNGIYRVFLYNHENDSGRHETFRVELYRQ